MSTGVYFINFLVAYAERFRLTPNFVHHNKLLKSGLGLERFAWGRELVYEINPWTALYCCDRNCFSLYLVCVNPNGDAESTGESKIRNLDSTILVDQQVLRLQITMQYTSLVAEQDTLEDLLGVAFD